MRHVGMLLHIGMILGGLALIVCGFWGSSQLRSPLDGLAALAAPIGLLLAMAGVILLAIPTFFT